jgi:hypothetical protein
MRYKKKQSVIDVAIEQINQCMINSRNPNSLTKRTGDYRIGLKKAKDILEELKAMHREETCQFAVDWFQNCPIGGDVQYPKHAEQYYNERFGSWVTGNNKQAYYSCQAE